MPFCIECGTEHSPQAVACPECGRPTGVGQQHQTTETDSATRMLLPVGRSGIAIAAGYVALFALVIFPLAPVALALGILAARKIRNTPDLHGMGRAIFAIIVGGLYTLAMIVMLVLWMIASS